MDGAKDSKAELLAAFTERTSDALWAITPDWSELASANVRCETVWGDRPPTFADVPDLEYTGRVLKEAMRLYPPVPQIPRETTERVELGGYELPVGATVAPSQWTVHRDERFWDDPTEFRPERFDGADDRPRFAYFPFGGGPRRCIGQQFAMVEGKLILATLARRFHTELASDPDVDLSVSITTRPVDPIEVRLTRRERATDRNA
jgi:cytochrome P450